MPARAHACAASVLSHIPYFHQTSTHLDTPYCTCGHIAEGPRTEAPTAAAAGVSWFNLDSGRGSQRLWRTSSSVHHGGGHASEVGARSVQVEVQAVEQRGVQVVHIVVLQQQRLISAGVTSSVAVLQILLRAGTWHRMQLLREPALTCASCIATLPRKQIFRSWVITQEGQTRTGWPMRCSRVGGPCAGVAWKPPDAMSWSKSGTCKRKIQCSPKPSSINIRRLDLSALDMRVLQHPATCRRCVLQLLLWTQQQ